MIREEFPFVSVVVCTYNRCALLRNALSSLVEQTVEPDRYEVIVVDNNSTDGTRQAVQGFEDSTAVPVRYVLEEQQGVSHARNRGIDEARGEIVAYLDDDELADPGWLAAMLDVYRRHPDVMAVTGRVEPIWERRPPPWFEEDRFFRTAVCVGDWGPEARSIRYPHGIIWVGNSSFRRAVFETVGRFDTGLGRRAGLLTAGEEDDLQCRIEHQGGQVYYAPEAVVYHYIPVSKLTERHFLDVRHMAGRAHYVVDSRYLPRGPIATRMLNLVIRVPWRLAALGFHLVMRKDVAATWKRKGQLLFTQGYVEGWARAFGDPMRKRQNDSLV